MSAQGVWNRLSIRRLWNGRLVVPGGWNYTLHARAIGRVEPPLRRLNGFELSLHQPIQRAERDERPREVTPPKTGTPLL
jgi:hypothetical protein